jgi:hypothetical protein
MKIVLEEMQPISALSLAPGARDWLANSRHPRILHVFDHVCNLLNEGREVLSIVTPQIGNGPFNLVVEGDALFSDHLNAQSPIFICANQLNLADLSIYTADANLWLPSLDWRMLHDKRGGILNQLKQLQNINYQNRGLDTPFATTAQGYSTTASTSKLPIITYQFSNSLISAIASADLPSCLIAAKQLAGLGQGLTPAGDDFILGAILAAWIIHPREVASVLAEEIANIAAPLTTSLSAAWLKSAGKGEAGILWHEFFDTLIKAGPVQIQAAMEKVLAVGETSGADALAGFIGTFISYAESETKPCPS